MKNSKHSPVSEATPPAHPAGELTKRIRARQAMHSTAEPFAVHCPSLEHENLVRFIPERNHWTCIVGGIEFTRDSEQLCREHAIELLREELERLAAQPPAAGSTPQKCLNCPHPPHNQGDCIFCTCQTQKPDVRAPESAEQFNRLERDFAESPEGKLLTQGMRDAVHELELDEGQPECQTCHLPPAYLIQLAAKKAMEAYAAERVAALNVAHPFDKLPDEHNRHVQQWLESNEKTPADVRSSLYPLGMVGRWIERAEKAEQRVLELEGARAEKDQRQG